LTAGAGVFVGDKLGCFNNVVKLNCATAVACNSDWSWHPHVNVFFVKRIFLLRIIDEVDAIVFSKV
jgi:hypothetical protein